MDNHKEERQPLVCPFNFGNSRVSSLHTLSANILRSKQNSYTISHQILSQNLSSIFLEIEKSYSGSSSCPYPRNKLTDHTAGTECHGADYTGVKSYRWVLPSSSWQLLTLFENLGSSLQGLAIDQIVNIVTIQVGQQWKLHQIKTKLTRLCIYFAENISGQSFDYFCLNFICKRGLQISMVLFLKSGDSNLGEKNIISNY